MKANNCSLVLPSALLALAVLMSLSVLAAVQAQPIPDDLCPCLAQLPPPLPSQTFGADTGHTPSRCELVYKRNRLWGHRVHPVRPKFASPVFHTAVLLRVSAAIVHLPLLAPDVLILLLCTSPRGP